MESNADIVDFVAERAKRTALANGGNSSRLAAGLDRDLMDAVTRLEGVATCQQAQAVTLDPSEREFARFCNGLEEVGQQLLDHLASRFLFHAEAEQADATDQIWIFQSRANSLIAWIAQLAHVHGLAFDDQANIRTVEEQAVLTGLTERLSARVGEKTGLFRNHSSAGA